ncbi:MAG: AAA family ATPase [Fimbriimonadaceae bacterium]|nr:AAA family ATPase [Fimbriimonadaceae bacterium]
MLIIFSGLPGVGKTTIAKELARRLGAVYLRADTVEQAMVEGGIPMGEIEGKGYLVAMRVATENLRLGRVVVADSVNCWRLTREWWRSAATDANAPFLDVEVICSDEEEHRRRVEDRRADIAGHDLPDWRAVVERDYHSWDEQVLVVDTAYLSQEKCVRKILDAINGPPSG